MAGSIGKTPRGCRKVFRTASLFACLSSVAVVAISAWLIYSLPLGFSPIDRFSLVLSYDSPAREIAVLKAENARLKQALEAQARETRERIARVNRLVGKLSDLTGLPIQKVADLPTTSSLAEAATTVTITAHAPESLGRGGPAEFEGPLAPGALGGGLHHHVDARRRMSQLASIEWRLGHAIEYFNRNAPLLRTTPLMSPIQAAFSPTDRFGERIHPIKKKKHFHAGLDFAAPLGTPIVSPADGVVIEVGSNKTRGRWLTIEHGAGLYPTDPPTASRVFRTRFYHCSKVNAKKGDRVKRGDVVALMGSTGSSTGSHLHYEVRVNEAPVDPDYFILDK